MNTGFTKGRRLRRLALVAGVPLALSAGLIAASPSMAFASTTGTAGISAGTLAMTPPSSLSWSTTLNGADQNLVDPTAADQGFQVNDSTGSGAGWHVTAAATTFTSTSASGTAAYGATLPTNSFSVTGSVTSNVATTAPSVACVSGSTCVVPTPSTSVVYPVAITTAASSPVAATIYSAEASSGMGNIQLGGSTATDPVGYWLGVPADTLAATYASTITINVVSGP